MSTRSTRATAAATANASNQAFEHVVVIVWGLTVNSPVYLTLKHYDYHNDVAALVDITDAESQLMKYPDPTDPTRLKDAPHIMISGKIRRWRTYLAYMAQQGTPLLPVDFVNIDKADFDNWSATVYIPRLVTPVPSPPSASSQATPIDLFKRGVKRDPSVFPVFKQDSQFDSWNFANIATANAQGCGNVVDTKFTPLGQLEIDLFEMQKTFMYSVFITTLQTDVGKELVRNSTDAHAIFKQLTMHYTESAKANNDRFGLMEYITSVRHGTGSSWRGTTHAFILHFQEKLRLLKEITPVSDHFSPEIERVFLQNAVNPISELDAVQTQAKSIKATTGKELTTEQYLQLLKDAALRFDSTHSAPVKRSPICSAMAHDFGDFLPEVGEEDYTIDTPVEVIQANAHARESPGYIPSDCFQKLSEKGRELWISMSPEDRAAIFGMTPKPATSSTPPPQNNRSSSKNKKGFQNSNQKVNLTEISAYDFIVMQHEMQSLAAETDTPSCKEADCLSLCGQSEQNTWH